MFTEEELIHYFNNLPLDLEIIIKDKIYKTNKQLISFFSIKIKELLKENENKLILNINDEFEVFNLILLFIKNEKIDINAYNDIYLFDLSKELLIEPLIELTKNSISQEISLNNVIPRFIQSKFDFNSKIFLFILENIKEIINKNEFYELPFEILNNIYLNYSNSFKNIDDLYFFGFRICSKYPENYKILFSNLDISSLSNELISILSSNIIFKPLEKILPLEEIGQRLLFEINKYNEEIFQIKKEIIDIDEYINKLKTNIILINDESNYIDEKDKNLNIFKDKMIENLNILINSIKNQNSNLNNIIINKKPLNEIGYTLKILKSKIEKIIELSNSYQGSLFQPAFRSQRKRILEISSNWNSRYIDLEVLYNSINSNEQDINEISNSFNFIINEIINLINELKKI